VLAKIFKHGGGSGHRAIDYQESELNHEGELRENPPELLRGDPETTAELIDSLEFAQKYTSGVLSFTPEEAARLEREPEMRFELIDSFERDFLAPGMDRYRLALVWTQHREHDRTELHFTIANVDLETSKRFPAYFDRADRTRLAAWQDYQNLSRGLDDPRDPERQRAVRHESDLPKEKAKLAEALEKLVGQKCVRGELEDRKAIVQFIESKGLQVGRQGKDYITVVCGEGKNDRFRLKGALFHEAYRFDRTVRAGVERDRSASEADRARGAEHARVRLETAMQFRRDYLEKRFGHGQERGFDEDRNVLDNADRPTIDRGARGQEVGTETAQHREMGSGRADHRDVPSVRGDDRRHTDLVEDREQGARPHEAIRHGQGRDADDRRRTDVAVLQRTDAHGQERQKDHLSAAMQEGERVDEHTEERIGHPSHGILAAVERRISAARSAFDRAVHELRGVLHEALDRAQTGTKRALEAFGRCDQGLRGHAERHAAALEAVGQFEQKARSTIKRIDRQLEIEHDRGGMSRW
jgi:hypothetical protein